ncbi:thioester reductase-like protein [Allocatelliglobosispora scoriae]|uniref:Thioester reductase-like protein n=1 Tax=Allocatelliglobosispora scoriae TaxID=643052 RepID=A0A841BNV0_9ACTN|nr:thioester reductase domain-containing protein [Allocatelliglobosispora scoriae]MBB5868976.1 thioester reductase-like protein [Allocatelliglobosispora scoriae]
MNRPILLTGATGFLGSRLCHSLLIAQPGDIHCLVRGRTPAGGERRLHARLDIPDELRHRIVVVPGDVRLPRLGLSEVDFRELAATVGAVYHCAASVNLAADYERLAPANVEGSRNVLALAQRGEHHLHYVSTLGVFLAGRAVGLPKVTEDTEPSWESAGEIGYCRTKLVAERELLASGVPLTIYRPGLVTGDTRTGECSGSDVVARIIRAAAALRAAPETTGEVCVGSVDFTARAIAALSLRPDAAGRTHHPVEEQAFPMSRLFDHLATAREPLERVDVGGWHRRLTEAPDSSAAFVLLAVWRAARHLLAETEIAASPAFDVTQTRTVLADEGVDTSVLDEPYFHRMIRRIITP